MTKEIVEQGSGTQVALPGNGTGRGFENFRMEDAILPRIRLNGKTGRFVSNLDDSEQENIVLVPLIMTRSRTMFDDAEDGENRVAVCRSPDGMAPTWVSPGFWDGDNRPIVCDACPYSKWQEGKQPPQCSLFWNLLAVEPDGHVPFVFSARGTSLTAVKKMMSVLKAAGGDLFAAEVTFGSVDAGQGTRTYSRMTFENHRWLETEEHERFAAMYELYVADDLHIAELLAGMQIDHSGDVDDEGPSF